MDDFATAKLNDQLGLVSILKKFADVFDLEVKVMLIGLGTKLHLLDFDDRPLLAFLTFLFGRFVLKATIVHDLAYGRNGLRRDLDQIKPFLACHAQGFVRVEYAYLRAIAGNNANARDADAVIDSVLLGRGWAAILSNGNVSEAILLFLAAACWRGQKSVA